MQGGLNSRYLYKLPCACVLRRLPFIVLLSNTIAHWRNVVFITIITREWSSLSLCSRVKARGDQKKYAYKPRNVFIRGLVQLGLMRGSFSSWSLHHKGSWGCFSADGSRCSMEKVHAGLRNVAQEKYLKCSFAVQSYSILVLNLMIIYVSEQFYQVYWYF